MKLPHPLRAIRKAGSSIKDIRARHSARKRSSGMGFLLADSVDLLDAQRWDKLTRDSSVWMRRDVLRAIEHSGPENVTPRYAMNFRDGIPVGSLWDEPRWSPKPPWEPNLSLYPCGSGIEFPS